MLLSEPILSLTISGEDPIVLVPSSQWSRLCAEGAYRMVTLRKAMWMLEDLGCRRVREFRRFLAEAHLVGFDTERMDDGQLLMRVREGLRDGRLLAVQKGTTTSANASATADLRRIVQQLERATRGKLSFRGRRYRSPPAVPARWLAMPTPAPCSLA
jgi:hypothetical protein